MFQVEKLHIDGALHEVVSTKFIDEFDNIEEAMECAKKHGNCRIIMVIWGTG